MHSSGNWSATCSNDDSQPSLYDQLDGQECTQGDLPGYGTHATCACTSDFCNSPNLMADQLMAALDT